MLIESQFREIVREHISKLAKELEASLERRCADITGRLERAEQAAREACMDRRHATPQGAHSGGNILQATAEALRLAHPTDSSLIGTKIEESFAAHKQEFDQATRQIFAELNAPLTEEHQHLQRSQQQLLDVVSQIQLQLRDVLAAQICLQSQEVQLRSASGTPRNSSAPPDQQNQVIREMRRQLCDLSRQEHAWNDAGTSSIERPSTGTSLRSEASDRTRPWTLFTAERAAPTEDEASGESIEVRMMRQ